MNRTVRVHTDVDMPMKSDKPRLNPMTCYCPYSSFTVYQGTVSVDDDNNDINANALVYLEASISAQAKTKSNRCGSFRFNAI